VRLGRFYAVGHAHALALVLSEPVSFWGGIDVETGVVVERSHPDLGKSVSGRILVMQSGRGSSSSSSVLAEMIHRRTGPVGIVLARPDPILTVASIVAQTLYGLLCPIVVCTIDGIATGDEVRISRTEAGQAQVDVSRITHADGAMS
jgi:predicted aconitase with swiveling domain